eukprot:10534664-Karenia_brevis.AAC.1
MRGSMLGLLIVVCRQILYEHVFFAISAVVQMSWNTIRAARPCGRPFTKSFGYQLTLCPWK